MSDEAKQIRILTVDDHPILRQGLPARHYHCGHLWAMPPASTTCVKFEDRRLAIVYKDQRHNAAAIDRY